MEPLRADLISVFGWTGLFVVLTGTDAYVDDVFGCECTCAVLLGTGAVLLGTGTVPFEAFTVLLGAFVVVVLLGVGAVLLGAVVVLLGVFAVVVLLGVFAVVVLLGAGTGAVLLGVGTGAVVVLLEVRECVFLILGAYGGIGPGTYEDEDVDTVLFVEEVGAVPDDGVK